MSLESMTGMLNKALERKYAESTAALSFRMHPPNQHDAETCR